MLRHITPNPSFIVYSDQTLAIELHLTSHTGIIGKDSIISGTTRFLLHFNGQQGEFTLPWSAQLDNGEYAVSPVITHITLPSNRTDLAQLLSVPDTKDDVAKALLDRTTENGRWQRDIQALLSDY